MTPSIDQTLHQFANLLPNWTLLPILTFLPNFGGFHRTLQRVQLANRGRLLLRTPGPVPFGTCIFVLMLRPFFPELVMSTDLLSFEHPSVHFVLLFFFSPLPMCHCWWTSCPRGYLSGSNCCYEMPKKVVNIVNESSPTINRTRTAMPPDTGMSDMAGVQRLVLKPVSHYGELGLRVYYEYWRVINRQKIREFAVDCGMSATSARVLFDIREVYDNRQTNTSLHDISTIYVRHPHDKLIFLYENIRVKGEIRRHVAIMYELCTTYDELYTRIIRVGMTSDDFGYKYPLNGTHMRKKKIS